MCERQRCPPSPFWGKGQREYIFASEEKGKGHLLSNSYVPGSVDWSGCYWYSIQTPLGLFCPVCACPPSFNGHLLANSQPWRLFFGSWCSAVRVALLTCAEFTVPVSVCFPSTPSPPWRLLAGDRWMQGYESPALLPPVGTTHRRSPPSRALLWSQAQATLRRSSLRRRPHQASSSPSPASSTPLLVSTGAFS